jgi:hypothetical protein
MGSNFMNAELLSMIDRLAKKAPIEDWWFGVRQKTLIAKHKVVPLWIDEAGTIYFNEKVLEYSDTDRSNMKQLFKLLFWQRRTGKSIEKEKTEKDLSDKLKAYFDHLEHTEAK